MNAFDRLASTLHDKPRRWLVTGVAGFIGSNLLQSLLELDQTVSGLDNFATGHRANLDEVRAAVSPERWARFRFVEGDVSSPEVCADAVAGVDACCTRRRSAPCRARSSSRSTRTRPTSPASWR